MATLTGHTDRLYGVQFNPDGSELATSSGDGTIRIWDVASGETARILPGPEFNSLDYSPDGKYLVAGGEDGAARIYILDSEILRARAEERLIPELSDSVE